MYRTLFGLPILSILLLATPAFAQGPVNISIGPNTSANWSGYVAANETYTGVGGSWTVPTPSSLTNETQADATWVGIGGVNSENLIQTGTQALIQNGSVTYQAWYELLPQVEQIIPITVHGGDSITASVSETGTNTWQISFTDTTTGQQYTTSVHYDSDNSSADWIEEQPIGISSNSTGYVPLDNFGTASFTNSYALVNGVQENLVSAGAQPITMITSDNQVLATPSALGSDDESFSVTRSDIASTPSDEEVPSQGSGRGWRRAGHGMQGFTPGITPSQPVPDSNQQQNAIQSVITISFNTGNGTYTFAF